MWKSVLGNCDPKREVVVYIIKKKCFTIPFDTCLLRNVNAVYPKAFPINDDEE